jgi:predicted dehydrogenase
MTNASLVRGTAANSKLSVGMIGCGGRGSWLVPLFEKHGGYQIVACADYYQDRVDEFGGKFNIDASRRYTTLSGYKRLLDDDVDVVAVESPPYFHPEHAAAAVAAGKHVYVAKPIAVDVPGCQSIAESGRKATENKRVFLVDFQTRANEFYREAAHRVHRGDLGRIVCALATYPWGVGNFPAPETSEDRLKRWYCYKALSGDFIIEQNIHALDVATWFLDADPVRAVGTGGSRKLRSYGDIYDYFNLTFDFPGGVTLSYMGNQCTPGAPNEIACRVYGSQAMVDTNYYSHVRIEGVNPYEGGAIKGLYTSGAETNVKEFHEAVTQGDCSNPTVAPSVRSNLTCVLGRTAAYKGEPVTWKELLAANERLEPDLSGLKS